MESNNGKDSPRRQRTAEEIIQLLQEFENSKDITVKEFCEMQSISDATYYYWRRVYGPKSSQQKIPGFIELTGGDLSVDRPALFAEVGMIKIYQPVTAEYLKTLVS